VFPRRHREHFLEEEPRRRFLKICRACHDKLEEVILAWERAIPKLFRYRDFYLWVAEAFLQVDDHNDLLPQEIPKRARQLPWAGYQDRGAAA
jgi:hypothetical protein